MISLISVWWIQQGNEPLVVPALSKLAKEVKANEKGTLTYIINVTDFGTSFPSIPEPRPGEITFVEAYRDWNAFQDHLKGEIFTTFKNEFGSCFVQKNSKNSDQTEPYTYVKFLTRLSGFDHSFE